MSIVGGGDLLARGARSVDFGVGGNNLSEAAYDFASGLGEADFCKKYSVVPATYQALLGKYQAGEVVETPAAEFEAPIEEEAVPSAIDLAMSQELPVFVRERPVVIWPKPENFTAKPFGRKVVVWRIPDESFAAVYLASIEQEKPIECLVIAVSDATAFAGAVEVNQKVMIRKFSGTEFKLDGFEYTILDVEDLLMRF